ncbi:ATP-binding protein [Streptomyces sp. WAC8370]|uniref:ATP-binding protein n=1 Tax=Streptomyces sp. WAC8370 TaxID=3351348 RepID=UPI003F7A4B61
MPQRPRFRPYGQPTLTLTQMLQQRLELCSQDGLDPLRSPHTRTTSPAAGSHDLFPGKPLEWASALYGRSSEVSALDEVITQARHGCGGAVVLRGEAGAGKTALLDAAAARGEAMGVLRTGGVESESDLAFAELHQLLWPVAGLLDALPGPQRDAVRAALGHIAGGAGDRFLLGVGVLSLLAEAAGPEGLICVVDDFQWVDRASADALLFAARRLGSDRMAMALAVRGDAPVRGMTSTVDVRGLPEDAAAELLESRHGVPAGPVRGELSSG